MKADFPAVARPWQWGRGRDGLGMADPPPSRGQLCHTVGDGRVSAEMRGQPQPPRAGIRPRVQRAVGPHGGSRGCWGKQREGGGKLSGRSPSPSPEAAPCLLLAVRDGTSHLPGLPSPCTGALAPSKDGKGSSLNTLAGHGQPWWGAGHGSAA